ncbi:hypothetical protein BWQ96_03064 [Gracilariopsis chorda]|uniref:SMP-30/Gluconolactonase/LRE-like region domain-containing protein n=1 Tax=Gracilariopsis chorda TaxID=448386 RepID=A0A2V3IY95_9FLOR|nr:hypothetical protein BWQ96_03064 [Gracilariopsis chorda]|eukprot:PXF47122.1 hypothetical protein BWQ96_03064 [Gracilariopsis chorda]
MSAHLLSLLLPTPPIDYKPISRNVISLTLIGVPLLIATLILKLVHSSAHSDLEAFQLSSNGSDVFHNIVPSSSTFRHVNAIQSLPSPFSGLLTCEHSTNQCFFLPKNAPMPLPLISNSGAALNETHAASLLRPGISSIAPYSCAEGNCSMLVTRHAARDVGVLTLAASSQTLYPTYQVNSLASMWNQTRFNAPNSLAVDARGNIFFSDAYFGLVESIDEFDRKLDKPPGATLPQAVYYMPALDILAFQSGEAESPEPLLLVNDLDRPSGVAVTSDNRLLVSVASPRKPCIVEYAIEYEKTNGRNRLVAKDPVVIYDWTSSLHNWQHSFFSGILGNIVLDERNRLYVGVADGVAVFDVSGRATSEKSPMAWIRAALPPGPTTVSYDSGVLYIAASSKVVSVTVM